MNFRNEDGLAFLKTVPSNSVQLVLTDPPYLVAENNLDRGGEKYAHFDTAESFSLETLDKFVQEWFRVLKPGGRLVCWFDVYKMETLKKQVLDAGFSMGVRLVHWQKSTGQAVEQRYNFLSWTEYALVTAKPPVKTSGVFNNKEESGKSRQEKGHWCSKTPLGRHRIHPTQKPLDLFEDLVVLLTNPGDVVLDSFAGSGTTGLAALKHGRDFWGTELNPEYFEAAQKRITTEK